MQLVSETKSSHDSTLEQISPSHESLMVINMYCDAFPALNKPSSGEPSLETWKLASQRLVCTARNEQKSAETE